MQRWDSGHPIVRFLVEDPDFDCIRKRQTGKVWRVNKDKSLYIELSCGHPYTLQPGELGTLAEPADEASRVALEAALNKEEEPMATTKAAKVASSKGVIPVQGHEDKVKEFKTDLNFFKQLEARVEDGKAFFRTLAEQVRLGAEGVVKRVEFISDGSATVPVTIPDVTKAGNRTNVKDEVVSKVAQLGFSLDEMAVTETEYSYELTGEFVAWLDEILAANYTSQGKEVPAGINKKATTRLTVEGIEKLRAMAADAKTEQEREAARVLLDGGIKVAGVSAK
jgi:hypothetical protein